MPQTNSSPSFPAWIEFTQKVSRPGCSRASTLFRCRFVREHLSILPVTVGLAMFPEDGQDLETLVSISNWQARESTLHAVQPG